MIDAFPVVQRVAAWLPETLILITDPHANVATEVVRLSLASAVATTWFVVTIGIIWRGQSILVNGLLRRKRIFAPAYTSAVIRRLLAWSFLLSPWCDVVLIRFGDLPGGLSQAVMWFAAAAWSWLTIVNWRSIWLDHDRGVLSIMTSHWSRGTVQARVELSGLWIEPATALPIGASLLGPGAIDRPREVALDRPSWLRFNALLGGPRGTAQVFAAAARRYGLTLRGPDAPIRHASARSREQGPPKRQDLQPESKT